MAEQIVGSKMPALNGYGCNGFPGASSDTPGQHTASGFLPPCDLTGAVAEVDRVQKRDVGKSAMAPTFGMTGPRR